MSNTVELVRYRLRQGSITADWLKANEKLNEWVKRQPGFHFCSLSETDDGEWIDVLYWENMAAAKAASDLAMNECSAIFAWIDEESTVMSHSKTHVMLQG